VKGSSCHPLRCHSTLTYHALLLAVNVLEVPLVAQQRGHGARGIGEIVQSLEKWGDAEDFLRAEMGSQSKVRMSRRRLVVE
jgi:hypothetical protein